MLITLWLASFGVGYLLHAIFQPRYVWPSAASALTASYFHIGAICFSWGFTSLLNPSYLTRRIVVRDSIIFAVGILAYWTVALFWNHAPAYTLLSFCIFFGYAVVAATTFYRAYNKVAMRRTQMSIGSVRDFVRWMQVCCDCCVAFGLGSVALTALFPTSIWPYPVLMVAGTGMFAYLAYSVNNYGHVINKAMPME